VQPSTASVQAVNDWLASHGIAADAITAAGDWVGFTTDVGTASALLDADFHVYQHASGRQVVRTLAYSVPADVREHVQLAYPTISWPSGVAQKVAFAKPLPAALVSNGTNAAAPSSCASQITPACLQALYGIPTTPATVSSNQVCSARASSRPDTHNEICVDRRQRLRRAVRQQGGPQVLPHEGDSPQVTFLRTC
jgi:tripeptidyl-peptidase-1